MMSKYIWVMPIWTENGVCLLENEYLVDLLNLRDELRADGKFVELPQRKDLMEFWPN